MMVSHPHQDSDARAIIDKGEGIWEFKPRAFNIVWGNDKRYWLIPSDIESDEPAELGQVSWLEVTSSIHLEAGHKYQISFKISMKAEAFGLNSVPVYLMAKVGRRGKYISKKLTQLEQLPPMPTVTVVPIDPFIVEIKPTESHTRLHFGLYEVWSGKWKSGLIIYGASVRRVIS